jgi:dihydrofolate synthase / folylpolyglutamate synthase
MRFNTLESWLGWLESLHPKSIELGLDRLRQVVARLPALTQLQASAEQIGRAVKVITVAGTNGKGSCVATLERLCIAAGQSVGAYTSPHLLHYNERICIDGKPAADERIIAAFERIDAVRGEVSLTYFEFGTLAALLLFVEAGVENVILEVGLGGRLDAVNLIDPDVAVVTSVDLDHQDWLGCNRDVIGREKAGVFRSHKPAICVDPDPPASLVNIAMEQQVDLLLAERDLSWFHAAGGWTWRGCDRRGEPLLFSDLPLPHLPLPSVAAALQAFILLGNDVSESRLAAVLRASHLPGRCQRLQYQGRNIVLDVAHNPAAALYLAERLQPFVSRRTLAVFAVMEDKDYPAMVNALAPVVDHWIVCSLPDNPRAASADTLLNCVRALGQAGQSCDTVAAGFAEALSRAEEGDQILVVGSFFTVAAVLGIMEETADETESDE